MASARKGQLALVLAGITLLSACEEGQQINLFGGGASGDSGAGVISGEAGVAVEHDVESPEVFSQTDTGLWDGRPSLGGVWIAHSDVIEPERVMIRNQENGKFIIGALFRRERENPGPRFQVSSDAAAELGMLAGAPSNLSVVALRRVDVPVVTDTPVFADTPEIDIATVETIAPAQNVTEATIDPVAALAASAIEAATAGTPAASLPDPANAAETALAATAPLAAPAAAAPAPVVVATTAPLSALAKPFVQIGIFSIEANANDTSDLLRSSGIIPTIKSSSSNGKSYWRVVVGPIGNSADRAAVISKVKGLGFPDAYAVTN
ncbi:MAG: SPOR domain-containing protein [Paracoccaceae bacterium]